MIKIITRFIGFILLALALIAAVLDITRSIADSTLVFRQFGQDWYNLSPKTLEASQASIERYILPILWDPVIVSILLLPTWLVLGVLALVFLFLGRKRKQGWREKYGT